MQWFARRVIFLVLLTMPEASAGPTSAPATAELGRDGDMVVSVPEVQGVDSTKLVALCQFLDGSNFDVRSLFITRNGRMIFERYEQGLTPDHNHSVYSVTKSFTSTLVGIALSRHAIDSIDRPILSLLPDVQVRDASDPRKAHITVEHLLGMRSGLQWTDTSKTANDPGTDLAKMIEADDRVSYTLNRPTAAEPGERFNYSNGDAQLLAGILRRATRQPVPAFAEAVLFSKLGFRNHEWVWPDKTGTHPGGYGLRLRPRDMLKFGQLFLQRGSWGRQQLVPAEWVDRATSDPQHHRYGYLWWTDIDAAGHASYSAVGFGGQFIRVIPDLRLVIVMTAKLDDATKNPTFAKIVNEFVIPACTEAPLPKHAEGVRALDAEFRKARTIQRKSGAPMSEDDTPRLPGRQ